MQWGRGERGLIRGTRGDHRVKGTNRRDPDRQQGFGLLQRGSALPPSRPPPPTPCQEEGDCPLPWDFSCTGEGGVHARKKEGGGMPLTEPGENTGHGVGDEAYLFPGA